MTKDVSYVNHVERSLLILLTSPMFYIHHLKLML